MPPLDGTVGLVEVAPAEKGERGQVFYGVGAPGRAEHPAGQRRLCGAGDEHEDGGREEGIS